MYQLDKNIDCTMTTITMAGVYYDPTVKYSLVSMAELASLNFQFRFGKHQSSVRKPAEINTCAACPHFQRLCNRFNWNPEFFCSRFHQQNDKRGDGASILQSCNKRGQAHSSLQEWVGYRYRLPKGLRKRSFPCSICQQAKSLSLENQLRLQLLEVNRTVSALT